MRKSKESMEGKSNKVEQEEKSPLEMMREAKERAERIAKEDKKGSAWNSINPDFISPDNLDLWVHFQKGELEIAQANLDAEKEKLSKIKDEKARQANENLLDFIDNQIIEKLETKKNIEDQDMDNY